MAPSHQMPLSSSSPDPLADSLDTFPHTSTTKPSQSQSRRSSITPKKRQSIKFEDLILSTPPRNRSTVSSPTKSVTQSENLISPWRIRVTVEAEPEDEEESFAGKATKTRMMTTTKKVPLKGMEDSSPLPVKKGRGRSRKSEGDETPKQRKRSGTPVRKIRGTKDRRKSIGSRMEGGDQQELEIGGQSTPKKRRGRPRKSLLPAEVKEVLPVEPEAEMLADGIEGVGLNKISVEKKGSRRTKSPTPFEIAVDPDIELSHAGNRADASNPPNPTSGLGELDVFALNPFVPRLNGEMLESAPKRMAKELTGKEETEAKFTPAKKTPVKASSRGGSPPMICLDEGHRPKAPSQGSPKARSKGYPTPASSPVEDVDLNKSEFEMMVHDGRVNEETLIEGGADPTDDHREFDSILESEGFSMVSLESIPSAQHISSPVEGGPILPQIAQSDHVQSQQSQGPIKQPTQTPTMTLRSPMKPPPAMPAHISHEMSDPSSTMPSSVTSGKQVERGLEPPASLPVKTASAVPAYISHNMSDPSSAIPSSPPVIVQSQVEISELHQTPSIAYSSPRLPPPPAVAQPPRTGPEKKTTSKLARVVRAGIALQGVAEIKKANSALGSPYSSPGRGGVAKVEQERSPREHLDSLFGGFGPETRRELRAGLRFGEELARRQRQVDEQEKAQKDEERMSQNDVFRDGDGVRYPKLPTPVEKDGYNLIAPKEGATHSIAPSPQPVTPPKIKQDQSDQSHQVNTEMARRHAEWQLEREAVSRQIQMANTSQVIVVNSDDDTPEGLYGEESEDDGDIWMQEANSSDPHSEAPSIAPIPKEQSAKPRRSLIPSTWKRGEGVDYSDAVTEDVSGMFWRPVQNSYPSVIHRSQRRRVRENSLDLSALIGTKKGLSTDVDRVQLSRVEDDHDHSIATVKDTYIDLDHGSAEEALEGIDEMKRRNAISGPSGREAKRIAVAADVGKGKGVAERAAELENFGRAGNYRGRPAQGISEVEDAVQTRVEDRYVVSNNVDEMEIPASPNLLKLPIRQTPSISRPSQQNSSAVDAPSSSSWFGKLTNLALSWLNGTPATLLPASSAAGSEASSTATPEEMEDVLPKQSDQRPMHQSSKEGKPERPSKSNSRKQPIPLSTSGYFTDDHYRALRLLYNKSMTSPESFPYTPTPRLSALLGLSTWSEDRVHVRPITELQLAIVDRFMHQLTEDSRRNGGSGVAEWDELDLAQRLFSIMVGEELRREKKMQAANVEGRA